MERIAKSLDELIFIWKQSISYSNFENDRHNETYNMTYRDGFLNVKIDFELRIPFPTVKSQEMEELVNSKINPYNFDNCSFLKDVYLYHTDNDIKFSNACTFEKGLFSNGSKSNITFEDCTIKELNFEDAVFGSEEIKHNQKGKVRFHNCHLYDVNFRNTTFNSLADYWNSTFYNKTTFYKTNFYDIVVFSAVKFNENVLFTYTLIDKLMILRGTYPKKGFDISLAIISGKLSIFDFQITDFYFKTYVNIYKDAKNIKRSKGVSDIVAYEKAYEEAVSYFNNIPIENKRETYRIFKNQMESDRNFIDAIPFKVMENKTLFKESWLNITHGVSSTRTYTRPLSNIIVLSLNAISNWYGSSYIIGIIFTLSIGALFFNGMLSHIGDFVYTSDYSKWQWEYFVKFINPTHRFDFMKDIDTKPENWFYIYDFLGRIFIGYGIYQTIQAFRKYK